MAATLKLGDRKWATKEGSLLAYNDENNNIKPLPFDFTRASSATRVNKQGLIETVASGVPRIDFTDANGALKLEPQRSNLYTYSNDVSFWTKSNVVTTSNYAISPDGTQNAFRAVSSSIDSLLYITSTGTIGTNNTLSVWAKSNGGISNKFRFFGNGATIKSNDYVATNEWQRFEFTYNCTSVTSGLTGASDSATNDILFYGFQHEEGSYATSYIPTQGSAVTRIADACSQTPPVGVIGQTEGTLYAEIDFKSKPEAGSPIAGIVTLNNNVSNLQNCIILGIERQSGGTNRFYPFVQVGNSTVAYIIGGTLTDGVYKAAFAYKQNDFVLYVNGVQIGTDSSGAVPTTSQVLVGERFNNDAVKIADGIKDTKLYNTRLSNAELIALTT